MFSILKLPVVSVPVLSKTKFLMSILSILVVSGAALFLNKSVEEEQLLVRKEKGCVFMTTFGEESSEGYAKNKIKKNIKQHPLEKELRNFTLIHLLHLT
mgnify:CR=1 FL=1